MLPMLMYIQSQNLNQEAILYLQKLQAKKVDQEYVLEYSLERVLKLIFRDPLVEIKMQNCEEILK